MLHSNAKCPSCSSPRVTSSRRPNSCRALKGRPTLSRTRLHHPWQIWLQNVSTRTKRPSIWTRTKSSSTWKRAWTTPVLTAGKTSSDRENHDSSTESILGSNGTNTTKRITSTWMSTTVFLTTRSHTAYFFRQYRQSSSKGRARLQVQHLLPGSHVSNQGWLESLVLTISFNGLLATRLSPHHTNSSGTSQTPTHAFWYLQQARLTRTSHSVLSTRNGNTVTNGECTIVLALITY